MTPSRRAGLAAVIVLALLLILDVTAWFWATGRMLNDWDAWRSQAAAKGLRIQSAAPVRSGWPFAADITLTAVAVDGGLAGWRADTVMLSLSALHPASLAIAIAGQQSLRLDGLPSIEITARGFTAAIPFGTPQQIAFEGHSITAALAGGSLEASVLAGRLDPAGLEIAASHLTIPAAGLPFGGAIDRFTARLHATVPLPLPGAAALTPAAMAAAWTQAGGKIVLDEASVLWGPLDAQGRFTAGLDSGLQPIATGTLHMSGYHAAIDALVRAGTIGRNAARVTTTVLDMMATSNDPPIVDVPLTLKGGTLAMGAIPLLRIPPITWP
jgi:hypothetical protein